MSPGYETITFKSEDGLTITADEYTVTDPRDCILLCHRSHFNRGEYRQTAPKLQALGYHCLAIEQRSGMNVYKVINETSTRAKQNVTVAASLEELDKPVYVTSAKKEIQEARDVVRFVEPRYVTQFEPEVDGFHGSKVLWDEISGSETYWRSLEGFLGRKSKS